MPLPCIWFILLESKTEHTFALKHVLPGRLQAIYKQAQQISCWTRPGTPCKRRLPYRLCDLCTTLLCFGGRLTSQVQHRLWPSSEARFQKDSAVLEDSLLSHSIFLPALFEVAIERAFSPEPGGGSQHHSAAVQSASGYPSLQASHAQALRHFLELLALAWSKKAFAPLKSLEEARDRAKP